MPSPFPGMNPYLEQEEAWHDFHERFMPVAAEALEAQVGPKYIVKIDEQVYVHELPEEERALLGRADIFVSRASAAGVERSPGGVLEAPAKVRLPTVDMEGRAFVEIRDRRSRELVTVIELLSPSNKKSGPDREQYIAKRARLLASPTCTAADRTSIWPL